MKIIDNIPVFGDPLMDAHAQLKTCLGVGNAVGGALMADHHLGYAAPVGAVIARHNEISPSEVGFDIACGNKAVLTDLHLKDVQPHLHEIMDVVFRNISFGIGRVSNSKNIANQKNPVDTTDIFHRPIWNEIELLKDLKDLAMNQLGTVGSGNHYVDIFHDQTLRIWVGVHFGSRGLGHKIASYYIKAGGGKDGIHVEPAVLSLDTELGQEYLHCMTLAGDYAYAGRDWVCDEVVRILGGNIIDEIHNHHNFSWEEDHGPYGNVWVTRKGATPAFPNQRGFVGATMGEYSVILQGKEDQLSPYAFYSTVHGAGRVLSRTQAAGKTKWKKGVKTRVSEGIISDDMMQDWVKKSNVVLRGAGVDESPHCYKRLSDVLASQKNTIEITNHLTPIGVAMAGADTFDPYKD
jgi:tRNA-splicing ligase RtcB